MAFTPQPTVYECSPLGCFEQGTAVPARKLVGDEIADVVAVARVLAPGVPEPDDEQVERRPLAAGPEPHGCA